MLLFNCFVCASLMAGIVFVCVDFNQHSATKRKKISIHLSCKSTRSGLRFYDYSAILFFVRSFGTCRNDGQYINVSKIKRCILLFILQRLDQCILFADRAPSSYLVVSESGPYFSFAWSEQCECLVSVSVITQTALPRQKNMRQN